MVQVRKGANLLSSPFQHKKQNDHTSEIGILSDFFDTIEYLVVSEYRLKSHTLA